MSITGMTTMEVKKINKSKVYALIYSEEIIAKQIIAQKLSMGISTVTQNLKLLEEEHLIEKKGFYESTGGRKAQTIQINKTAKISIGVDILKNKIHLVSIDLYGNVLDQSTINIPFLPSTLYCESLGKEIDLFIENKKIDKASILGVSIAIQGIISTDGQSISYGEILHHRGMQLQDFSRFIPYPCKLQHDSKAAAYLEIWHNKRKEDALFFLLNHNLGGAVIIDEKVHTGLNMHSGTLEHMCINIDGPLCYCGKKGCLETYCSVDSLQKSAGMEIKDFFKQLREENKKCKIIWESYLTHLAFAIRNLNVVIDSNIILSGFLAPYFTSQDIAFLTELVTTSSPFQMPEKYIFLSTHGELAPATGAALYYIDNFLKTI